jgi:hypothetical protein
MNNLYIKSGGSTSDKTPQVLINEVITPGYDTARFQITNGSMSEVGGKLRVVCSQATSSSNLSNGIKNPAITSINIDPTVRSYTALLNYEIDITFTIVTTSANRQYVGFGLRGTGERNPQSGGILISHSSNGRFLKFTLFRWYELNDWDMNRNDVTNCFF